MKWKILIFFLLMSRAAAAAEDTPVRVGQADSAGLMATWTAILKEAGIRYQMVFAPNAEKRRWFVRGNIILDCCATPEWRDRAIEKRVQLFSDVFLVSEEHFVFRKGKVVPINGPNDLLPLTFAIVRGFDYPAVVAECNIVAGRDVNEMLDLIASGKADIGLISQADFQYYINEKQRDLELGGLNQKAGLRIRVHKSRPDLLDRINKAIATMKADGRLNHLLEPHVSTR
ncbi:substrate-binding periplasmic protein [Kordiimonas marina]|uniref:substrate-binding periplasmic protein n=1 Tax=Kordiimonas marina TaxID=2872312 RepID=UPI001FF3F10A|nr:transporter substrate-binding domain-containing protein [Kordiimonas marina]MCJ9428040.1 transporter substrate-binding domain-containing protein [Kordiimonas marina]